MVVMDASTPFGVGTRMSLASGVCQAHCWVLRQPAASPVREWGWVFLEDTGHRVVRRPAGLPVLVCTDWLGGFVRCLRTA